MTYDRPETEISHESIYDKSGIQNWYRVNRYYAMNFDFFEMEPHTHREFEIMYAASGNCKIFFWTEEGRKEELHLKKGEYVFIDCYTRHQLAVEKGTPCRILNLEMQLVPHGNILCLQDFIRQSKSLQSFLKFSSFLFKGYDAAGNLHTIITELHRQLQSDTDREEHQVMQNLILAQLFVELSRQRTRKYYTENGSIYVRKALAYLSNNYDQDIKIKDIANEIEISLAYLQRLFKEETGKTLVGKINELRIEKAKILLETSSLPIADIAVSVGFNNRQHFTYMFFKLAGCSPALFRKHKGDYRVWSGFEE